MIMKDTPFLHLASSSVEIAGTEIAALWPTSKSTQSSFAKLFYDKTVKMHKLGFRTEAIEMSQYFDGQIYRYYQDQRSGSNKELEPLKAAVAPNKVLKDGISRFSDILADQSSDFFYYLVSGTGTTAVSVGQRKLAAENARSDMRVSGVMDSAGNILLMRTQFPTGTASATITEFGAADRASDPSTFAWRVLLDPSEYFVHEQGETWYTASHYLAMYAK